MTSGEPELSSAGTTGTQSPCWEEGWRTREWDEDLAEENQSPDGQGQSKPRASLRLGLKTTHSWERRSQTQGQSMAKSKARI